MIFSTLPCRIHFNLFNPMIFPDGISAPGSERGGFPAYVREKCFDDSLRSEPVKGQRAGFGRRFRGR